MCHAVALLQSWLMAKERLRSPRARLFVALDLPDEIREGVVAWQRQALGDRALRPVRPESLHLTLVFLGYHPEKQIDRITEAALPPGGAAPELRFVEEPRGVPRGKRPRLYAIEAESEETVALQARISDRLEEARFYKPEKRSFWPHLTVARVKPERRGSRKPALVKDPPARVPEPLLRPFRAVRLRLYRSFLRPQGAEYVPVAEIQLDK